MRQDGCTTPTTACHSPGHHPLQVQRGGVRCLTKKVLNQVTWQHKLHRRFCAGSSTGPTMHMHRKTFYPHMPFSSATQQLPSTKQHHTNCDATPHWGFGLNAITVCTCHMTHPAWWFNLRGVWHTRSGKGVALDNPPSMTVKSSHFKL